MSVPKPKMSLRDRHKKFINAAEGYDVISPLVPVAQFKENCSSLLTTNEIDFHSRVAPTVHNLSNEMGVTEDVVQELEEVCSPLSLTCPLEGEVKDWDDPAAIPDGTGLITLDHCKSTNSDRSRNKVKNLLRSKYTEMSCAMIERAQGTEAADPDDVVQCPEVVLTITVYFPKNSRRYKSSGVDFLVLGSQKLCELADKIPCGLGEQPLGNFTDNPDHPTDIKLKHICTSSLFLIENTFYNDLRHPSSFDLSRYLTEWPLKSETMIPDETEVANMAEVRFDQLMIRFGYPYVFLHLGNCEHLFMIKDIKLFSAGDCQSRRAYPITISRAFFKANPCDLCNIQIAVWITVNDELSERCPSIFCDGCFRALHYDRLGNKQGQFFAYPRINISELDY